MVMVPSCCASFGFKALRGRKAAWEVVSVVVKVDGDIEVYEVDGVVCFVYIKNLKLQSYLSMSISKSHLYIYINSPRNLAFS